MRSSVTPLLGRTTPRLWTPPLVTGQPGPCGCGCPLSPETSHGFSVVDFSRDVLEVEPLPWQRWWFIHALELRPDGRWRFRILLTLAARQNGKTTKIEVKNLWKLFVLHVGLIIGTAQDLDTAEESWDKGVEIVESIPELEAELAHVDRTNGKKALRLVNGSRWKIVSTSRRGGRGKSGDDVNLDELREHLDWLAWGAVTKTTMARPNAQIFPFSNAGDDRSVVLNSLRAQAIATIDDPWSDPSLGIFEWSAPDDVRCDCGRLEDAPHGLNCRLRDREAWAQANPALGYTITEEAIESALTDPEPVFRTEVLCQRVPSLEDPKVITPSLWSDLADPPEQRPAEVTFALVVNQHRTVAYIAYAGRDEGDPEGMVRLGLADRLTDVSKAPARLLELRERHNPVGVSVKARSESLLLELQREGLAVPDDPEEPRRGDLHVPSAAQDAAATGLLLDAARSQRVRHAADLPVDTALGEAKLRPSAGGVTWDDKAGDMAPLRAVCHALWLFESWAHLVAGDYDALANIY